MKEPGAVDLDLVFQEPVKVHGLTIYTNIVNLSLMSD